ncbi:MAG: hypothetical protein IT292_01500 [Deltaproteobacteria bacterium]|nr:hypothetical protein [Deltaproteobacteria bacterium]
MESTLKKCGEHGRDYHVSEILLCHNGSYMPPEIAKILNDLPQNTRLLHTDVKGLGAGYKLGIANATSEYVVLSADDIPFGFSDIDYFINHQCPKNADIAVGSKAHLNSKIFMGIHRKIISTGFRICREVILNKNLPKDTQGTIIAPLEIAKKLANKCILDDYFFSLEFLYIAHLSGYSTIEIPVTMDENYYKSSEPSTIRIFRDSLKAISSFSKIKKNHGARY